MEAHPLAQGNPHGEAIGAHLGEGKGQLRLDLATGVDGIERVADGTQQLHRPEGVGPRWIDGVDAVFAGDDELVGAGRKALLARLALAACKAAGEAKGQGQSQKRKGPVEPPGLNHSESVKALPFKGDGWRWAEPGAGKFQRLRSPGGLGASAAASSGCGGRRCQSLDTSHLLKSRSHRPLGGVPGLESDRKAKSCSGVGERYGGLGWRIGRGRGLASIHQSWPQADLGRVCFDTDGPLGPGMPTGFAV